MAHVNKLFEIEQKGFNIRFHDLFDMDDDTIHNFFPLHKKRVYQSIMERIVEDLKHVFREYPDFIESYLRARLLIEDIEQACRKIRFLRDTLLTALGFPPAGSGP